MQRTIRCFSTSTKRSTGLGLHVNKPELVADTVPEYPYPTRLFKRASKGLYGGSRIRFGNNTSEEYRTRTRRTWLPNVQNKSLYSKALGGTVKLPVTTNVLRTIEKVGGLDEYLLGEKEARIKELGETGWWLRWAIMQTAQVKKRYAKERAELGLPVVDTTPEPDSLVAQLDEHKKELVLKAKRDMFLHFRNGRWKPYDTEKERLRKEIVKLNPTRVLKKYETAHADDSEPATRHTERIRVRYFKEKQQAYDEANKAYKSVKPWEKSKTRL